MSILTSVAAQALADFEDDFEDGTMAVPGGRLSDGQGGFISTQPQTFGCKVLVTNYDDLRRQTLGLPATDRRVLVLAASLPSGVIPLKGCQITAPDPSKGLAEATFEVVAISGDPAGAVYVLQAS